MKKTVFLETHNIQNRATGLGVFNYELIKGFSQLEYNDLNLTVNVNNISKLKSEFKDKFKYNQYISLTRYKFFRPPFKYDLWHSVNQNTKIEPYFCKNYLLTIHDVNFIEEISSDLNHKKNKAFIAKLERSTAITYISEYAKKQAHSYFDIPKVPEFVIHNGNPISSILDTSKYISPINIDKPFLYTIGDFIERKNFLALVNMMIHIKDFNLIISGNNNKHYGKQVEQLILDNNLQDRVFLTGRVDEIAKQYYLSNCLAFVFPAFREGFGLPPIEAMKFGKPVFLANKTSLPEIGGEHAYYWDNFDPEYMKDRLMNGLEHFFENQTIMEQHMKKRADCFNWKTAAGEYLKIYNSILK